jgi:hypothetical protein
MQQGKRGAYKNEEKREKGVSRWTLTLAIDPGCRRRKGLNYKKYLEEYVIVGGHAKRVLVRAATIGCQGLRFARISAGWASRAGFPSEGFAGGDTERASCG